MEPTTARIVEDVSDFARVLQIIVDKVGCVVPDEALRHGRRERRADSKAQERLGNCTTKLRSKQRKSTMVGRP
jgi:hypothetical protein